MLEIKTLLTQPIFRSSIPLLVEGSYHLLKWLFSHCFISESNQSIFHSDDDDDGKHNLNGQAQNNGVIYEGLAPNFLTLLNRVSFGIYANFSAFLLVMLLIDVSFKIAQQGAQNLCKEVLRSKSRTQNDPMTMMSLEKEPIRLFGFLSENQIIRILCYVAIFIVLQITGFCLSFVMSETHPHIVIRNSQNPGKFSNILNIDQEEEDYLTPIPRILEQEIEDVASDSSVPTSFVSPDKFSLSMGTLLGSLNIEVSDIVLSKDRKIAFVALNFYGTLNIIDISDLKAPTIKSSLNLKIAPANYRVKSFALSSDEKTLYASSCLHFEIVDISNLDSPQLVSSTHSEILNGNELPDNIKLLKPSLAVDEKRKVVYIGGLGLQVYDISDPKTPVLLKALDAGQSEGREKNSLRNELCLSHDRQALFVANGTLDVYDVSSPKEMKLLNSLKTGSQYRSLLLSEDGKTAFLVGIDPSEEILFEEVDISNPNNAISVRKTTKLGYQRTTSPRFVGVYPSKTRFFILAPESLWIRSSSLLIFDSIKEKTIMHEEGLIEDVNVMHFSPDGKNLITASNSQFKTIELFFNYPNSQIFSGTLENFKANLSFSTAVASFEISKDEKFLFVLLTEDGYSSSDVHLFEIWDLQNINEPKFLNSFNSKAKISKIYLTKNSDIVYLLTQTALLELDVSNKSSINVKRTYQGSQIASFVLSPNEETGFVLQFRNSRRYIVFLNLSNSSSSTIQELFVLEQKYATGEIRILPRDDKTLIVINTEILIYDISNLHAPTQIVSFSFALNEPDPSINSAVLSEDTNTLFMETFDHSGFRKLRIYNISMITAPQLIGERYFSRFEKFKLLNRKAQFSLSPDQKTGFAPQNDSLIKLDLTNLKEPKVIGIVPIPSKSGYEIEKFIISSDGQTIYTALRNKIYLHNTNVKNTLYLNKEKFLLGEKYSDKVLMLNLTGIGDSDYNPMKSDSYKIIKLSLLDIKVAPNQYSLDITTSSLPSWITFDIERDILTVEPKKQRDLGTYTLHSAFSLKVPIDIFNKSSVIGTKEKPIVSEDLVAWLISLDYLDSELFLTAKFKSLETFYLPVQYSEYKSQIYQILQGFYVETCTLFEIIPSLELSNDLKVSTLSTNEIKVEIKLEGSSQVKFLDRPYAGLLPVIKENKTKISLEGPINEVNAAIGSIVVNYENGAAPSNRAKVVVNDGFNPPVSMELTKISKYFRANKPPKLNTKIEKTLQEQIDGADIETGTYFAFTLSGDIFEDDYAESLNYELATEKSGAGIPNWLSLNGLTLKGIPPEELLGRDIDLKLIAKNEFKQYGVPFKLNIKISATFWLKLLLRYSPYILTFVGLFVSANKIFDILRKRQYKHPKEYHLGVGEEISPEVIQPILFINEELKQSEMIFKFMKKSWRDFVDPVAEVLNKEKIKEEIENLVQKIPSNEREKIDRYPSRIIDQIIVNKFVFMQLDSDSKTKNLFEELKFKCMETVVERNSESSSGFVINQNKLNKLLMPYAERRRNSGDHHLEENLIQIMSIPGVNLELFEDAILAFAFEKHTIDISPVDVDIEVKQQIKSRFLFKFLKLNLRNIYLNDRNKIDYGINYRIIDDKLLFYGITQSYFQCKTLAVQIKNMRHKIMKEIWIHGSSGDLQKDLLVRSDQEESRSQAFGQGGYEVF